MKCSSLMTLKLLAAVVLFAGDSLAATVTASERSYTYSCGYFSSSHTDVSLTYRNEALPWGSIVELIYGFQGYQYKWNGSEWVEEALEWQKENRVVLPATAGYEWGGIVSIPRAYRSGSEFFYALNFVFRLIRPDGTIEFDNGGDSPWGFYVVDTGRVAPACVTGAMPAYRPIEVGTIERY